MSFLSLRASTCLPVKWEASRRTWGGVMPSPCFTAEGGLSRRPSPSNSPAAPPGCQPPPRLSAEGLQIISRRSREPVFCTGPPEAHAARTCLACVGGEASDQAVPCPSALPARAPSGQIGLASEKEQNSAGGRGVYGRVEGRKRRCH